MPRRRKILADYSRIDYGPSKNFNFADEAWSALASHLPVGQLDNPDGLRREVEWICAFVIGFAKNNTIGDASASSAVAPGGKARRATLQRMVAALQEAQAAWQEMRAAGFRLSAIVGADNIEPLAAAAQELLSKLPDTMREPVKTWPILVRSLHAALRRAGCQPTAHKRVYEDGKPTWFQEFVRDLDSRLPDGVSRQRPEASPEAFYSAVVDALSEPGDSDEEKGLVKALKDLSVLANESATPQQSGEK
jgi:hypothetical protein